MILQQLNYYYERLLNNPDSQVAPPGFSVQKIHFALVITKKGKLLQIKDLRTEGSGNKKIPRNLIVPEAVKRTVGIDPNFLWDNSAYILGFEKLDDLSKKERAKRAKRISEMFSKFQQYHEALLKQCNDDGLKAVVSFVKNWEPEFTKKYDYAEEISSSNIVFILDEDDNKFIHQRQTIVDFWLNYKSTGSSDVVAECLITGAKTPIARIHPPIKGVRGARPSGAAIVSFNIDSFISYNKTQSYNAPISETAAFSYTTALNYLLRSERQKIQIGDATTVFWTERDSPVENLLGVAIDPEDASEVDQKKLKEFLEAAKQGKMLPEINQDIAYYILGVSPNASRIAVRFWHISTVRDIIKQINEHFSDMEIIRNYPDEREHPGIWRLLRETAVQKDSKNISPLLAGSFARSILTGDDYPRTILITMLGRIKADGDINYYRASLIKGYLNRYHRKRNFKWEVSMSLNTELKDHGYRLGRLFAVLEKAQQEAINPNATIKDRYFGSASATPRAVFPQLLRNAGHHFAKLDTGRKVNLEKLVQEIVDDLQTFPAHLSLENQGMFALGYYQQRKDLFTAKA
jgi:CRISPR-associated protein Csd1